MKEPRWEPDEERLRRAFNVVSREINENYKSIQSLKHRQLRIERLILKALRDFKKFFTVNQN